MKTKSLILSILCLLAIWQMKGQSLQPGMTPASLLDTVYDQYGKKYALNDIMVDTTSNPSGGAQHRTYQLCTSGYFNLYFEVGSGMEGTSSTDIARRNVICQVFSDISNFINSPLSSTNKVNIWVRNISNMIANPSGLGGLATSFYSVPTYSTGGIIDNEIWKTIHLGVNSYTNVVSPLIVTSTTGSFYHGAIGFNFTQPGVIDWNTNLSLSGAPSNQIDLYTVALHEVTHALGVVSLINYNGVSKFGSNMNYYSRYDLLLKYGTNKLITNSGACSLYNYQFNPALSTSIMAPSCTLTPPVASGAANITTCSVAITYSGTSTFPVYTPPCFEPSASLMHFEDMCYPSGSPYGNDLYFSMSNSTGFGATYTKRYLKPEERNVLCDLGYNVNTTFGNSINNNYYNYGGSACSGISVAGANDGISSNGVYTFVATSGATINISGILSNDINASNFECLEDLTAPSTTTLSTTSGSGSTVITFKSSTAGIHLLRYVPYSSSTGKRGNITYIYVLVNDGSCSPNACDGIINNPDLESGSACGNMPAGTSCFWSAIVGTPDMFTRSCVAGDIIPSPTYSLTDTYSGTSFGNNACVAIGGGYNHFSEGIQNQLLNPLVPNQNYVVSFWGRRAANISSMDSNQIQFSAIKYPNMAILPANISQPLIFYVPSGNAVDIIPPVRVPRDGNWHHFSIPFTFTATSSFSNVAVYNNGTPYPSANTSSYIFLDGISIESASQAVTLNLPSVVCNTMTISDLSAYLSPPVTGGVFSGPGVTYSGGLYSFSAASVGIGTYNILYTYTVSGCQKVIGDEIVVSNGTNITLQTGATPTLVCPGTTTTLSATGATTYTWQPGNVTGSPVVVTPFANTIYTVSGQVCGSIATKTIAISTKTMTAISAVANPTSVCSPQSFTLTASGSTSYTWMPGGITGASVTVTPTTTTIYTVNGTVPGTGCTPITTVAVIVSSPPTVSVTKTVATICNSSTTFTAVTTPTNVTYSWKVWDASMTSTLSVPITGSTTATPTINFSNAYQNVNICVTVTNSVGCTNTACTSLAACCQTPTNTIKFTNANITTNMTLAGPAPTIYYQFGGTITVSSGTLTIDRADVKMDPFTKIIVNSGAKLDITSSYLHGCNGMWNGIVAVDNATVNINQSWIEDGLRTLVDSTGGSTFIVKKNYFINNLISIIGKGVKPSTSSYTINQNIFTASSASTPTTAPYVTTIPSYTVAPYLYSYPVSNLKYPYQNQKANIGIQLLGSGQTGATNNMVPIGTGLGLENIFDKLQIGIHSYLSSVLIQNNVIQNINSSVNPGTKMGGVYCEGYSGFIACHPPFIPCPTTNTVVVSSGTTTANTFKDNDYGVYSTGKLALSVISNTFTNQSTGVYITNNNASLAGSGGNDVTISRNKINTSVIGIELYNNLNGKYNAIENRIDNTTTNANANYQNNFGIRCSEASLSTNPSVFPYYNIYNNYINKYYNGIYTSQTFSTQISDNQIYMLPDNTSLHFQMGINFNNTNNCNIISNQLYCAASYSPNYSSWWQYGIATSNSAVPRLRCNYVENIPMGLVFNGSNYTTAGDGIIANSLNGHFIGMWLYGNAEIGDQYYTSAGNNYSADNQWTNTNAYQTYVSDGNLNTAPGTFGISSLYSRTTTNYTITSYFPSAGTFTANPLKSTSASNTSVSCSYSATPSFKINANQILNAKLMQRGREIAKDSLVYLKNAEDIKQVDRRHLLRNIKLQELDVNLDNTLYDFMDMVPDENTGLFYRIDSLLTYADTGNINWAQSINSSITTTNTADALQKQLNNLYIQEKTSGLDASGIQQLEYIALQCPNLYGQAVIQARTIAFQHTHKQYVSDCEKPNMPVKDIKARKNMTGQSPEATNVLVYPNPANQELFVEAEGYEQVQLKVYDVIGQLILDKMVKVNQPVNTESLSMGTYIYKVFNQAEILKTGKLIIAK